MPYITKKKREQWDWEIVRTGRSLIMSNDIGPGDLNYIISSIIWKAFDKDTSYTKANELIGVLECVKQEFYRRKVVPYEEEKMKENGDIL